MRDHHIFNDEKDNVYVSAYKDGDQLVLELSSKLHKFYTHRRSRGKALNGTQWFNIEKKGNNVFKINKFSQANLLIKEVEIKSPDRHEEGKHHIYMYPKAEDFNGNIYIDIYENRLDQTKKDWIQREWVAKYDEKGDLLAVIQFEENTEPIMDFTGSFYQIGWERPGDVIKLIKWRER